MHVIKPGWGVRAFRLDGTSIEGKVERLSGRPYKWEKGRTETTVVLEDGSEHLTRLCEPAGETFTQWARLTESQRPVRHRGHLLNAHVHFDTIAYKVIDNVLGGHWSSHLTEYVSIDWNNRTMKSNQLSVFVGCRAIYDKDGCLVSDEGDVLMSAEDVLEKLATVAWAYQDDRVKWLQEKILPAFSILEQDDVPVRYIHLPKWAQEIWPGNRVHGVSFCEAPFPVIMSDPCYGRFVPLQGIVPGLP